MTFRGDLGRYARVLDRLREGWPLAQILANDATLTRSKLAGVVRRLAARGWIEPSAAFSYLDADGFGGKRYVVTRKGKAALEALSVRGFPRQGDVPSSGGANSRSPPARIEPPVRPPPERPVVLGPHNIAYTCVIEKGADHPFPWERASGRGGTVRHGRLGIAGFTVQEAGIARGMAPDGIGMVVTFRFRGDLKGPTPIRTERQMDAWAYRAVREFERRTGAHLSEPKLVTTPKWSVKGDPLATEYRRRGIAVIGTPGGPSVDDTPETGTLELAGAGQLERYVRGVEAVGNVVERVEKAAAKRASIGRTVAERLASLDSRVGRLEGEVAGMRADQSATTAVLERLTGLLEKALTTKPTTATAPEPRAMGSDDRRAYG